jgi:hypothetical protein
MPKQAQLATAQMFRSATMMREPPLRILIIQIATIRVSSVDLQQFFARESRPNSFVVNNFTVETYV